MLLPFGVFIINSFQLDFALWIYLGYGTDTCTLH